VVARGGNVDEIAQRIAFTHRVGIDIFEEAAKFRAARRVWARMLREEFGATNPRALSFKVHAVTKGTDYTRQQPENNIVRIAYQALAAVLGGVQSMHTMSYDEPICLPTEESQRIAVRTQQILAYETGVVNVADPLGGSYYVESLTNRLAEEIDQIMEEHKETIVEEIYSERLMHSMQRQAYEFQQEVESGTRKVIGVNCFQISKEDERKTELHKPSWDVIEKYVEDVKELKRTRDNHKVRESVANLRKAAERKEENLVPAAMDAVRSYASLGEIWGAIRLGYGYSYDPFEEIEYPF
jgi:methylmalonyl-CoA mutase N-terminal domain/subunit